MFYAYNDERIRYTGRWGEEKNCRGDIGRITTTATGAYLEFSFEGTQAVIHFDTALQGNPMPHLWISMDNGDRFESVVMPYLRLRAENDGKHTVCIIVKSAVETQQRWYTPLVARVSLRGITVERLCAMKADVRQTIEFVGDSITEGILIDENCRTKQEESLNRVYQDDVCATYAWLAAEKLQLRPIMMGYGAVGVTKGGSGGVPKASLAYPYNFSGSSITYDEPDYILINHGTNDMRTTSESYCGEYRILLDVVRHIHPHSKIIAMAVLYGVHSEALAELIALYNREHKTDIAFINASGWVSKEPLHPMRDGHKLAAEKLADALRQIIQSDGAEKVV